MNSRSKVRILACQNRRYGLSRRMQSSILRHNTGLQMGTARDRVSRFLELAHSCLERQKIPCLHLQGSLGRTHKSKDVSKGVFITTSPSAMLCMDRHEMESFSQRATPRYADTASAASQPAAMAGLVVLAISNSHKRRPAQGSQTKAQPCLQTVVLQSEPWPSWNKARCPCCQIWRHFAAVSHHVLRAPSKPLWQPRKSAALHPPAI